MTEVTRQIAAGEYTARVPLAATDEVGQLALAFSLCGKESLQIFKRSLSPLYMALPLLRSVL